MGFGDSLEKSMWRAGWAGWTGIAWGCWVSQGCPRMLNIHGVQEHHRSSQERWVLCSSHPGWPQTLVPT